MADPTDLPDLAHVLRQRRVLVDFLADFTEKELGALYRRAEHPVADGYAAGHSEVNVNAASTDTLVERVVFAMAGGREGSEDEPPTPDTWQQRPDPVVGLVVKAFEHLAAAVVHVVAVDRLRGQLDDVAGRGRESTVGRCACCERVVTRMPNDRLRGGYCDACRMAWERAGRPGADPQQPGLVRKRWEDERRSSLKARRAS